MVLQINVYLLQKDMFQNQMLLNMKRSCILGFEYCEKCNKWYYRVVDD